MRIGILTFCNAYNLGGALQAFSLQKVMEEMEHDTELIDYRCPAIDKMHMPKPVFSGSISLKSRLYNLIYNIVFGVRRIRYKGFFRRTKRSEKYTKDTISESNGRYDLFVSGSDQVFNFRLTGYDSTYYLDFVSSGKKISYAASMGVFLPEKRDEYYKYLQSIDYLSVREKSTADLINIEYGINAKVMPDPVFLHSKEEWMGLLGIREKKQHHKYVLVYSLIENKDLYLIANSVAIENNLKIIVITKALKPLGKADKFLRNTGPKEFISLIMNADYVVTNSFHGTAFSIIFKKQFTVLIPPVASERIDDLLVSLNLKQRETVSYLDYDRQYIDYSQIDEKLLMMKNNGIEYLRTACNI